MPSQMRDRRRKTVQRSSIQPLANLIDGVARANQAEFRALYERTRRFTLSRIMDLIGDRFEAEELLQDVYVKIWIAAPAFDPRRGKAITWIGAIARNVTINRIRSAPFRGLALAQPILDADEIQDDSKTAEAKIIDGQTCAEITCRIRGLRPTYREVIEMVYLKGLSYHDMSELTGVPVSTLKTRARRAIFELKRDVGGTTSAAITCRLP